jgi:hypothetical protein
MTKTRPRVRCGGIECEQPISKKRLGLVLEPVFQSRPALTSGHPKDSEFDLGKGKDAEMFQPGGRTREPVLKTSIYRGLA